MSTTPGLAPVIELYSIETAPDVTFLNDMGYHDHPLYDPNRESEFAELGMAVRNSI